jgi:hypothetical protein
MVKLTTRGSSAINPLSPPSDPVQRRLQSPPAKSNFLAGNQFPEFSFKKLEENAWWPDGM